MAKVDPALWRHIMDYLRRRHAPICRQWFESLEPLELDTGLLKVATSNGVQQNYLQKRCLEPFTEAAQSATGALVAVQFVTGESSSTEQERSDAEPALAGTGSSVVARTVGSGTGTADVSTTPAWRSNRATSGVTSSPAAAPATSPSTPGSAKTPHIWPGAASPTGAPLVPPIEQLQQRPQQGHVTSPSPASVSDPDSPGQPNTNNAAGDRSRLATWPEPAAARLSAPVAVQSSASADTIVLCPDYSFDQFVTGPANRLAYAASIAVANQPGTAYNPLFIHGGCGLGKTHLLQAICQLILTHKPDHRICYLSCDAFMNDFIDCVQQGKMSEFRHRYRHVDVLVIDDIHFLANKERSQEEFFHTFNELYQSNRQIVISSDSPPHEIPQLEERLVSRFQWGLVAHVSKPDFETRIAILRAKARLRGVEMPDDVIAYVANRMDSNARELEGAITTIQGHAALQDRAINLQLALEALGEPAMLGGASQATLQTIIDAVTAYYNVKLSDLQSKRRHKSITEPRQVCMWLARKRTRFSLEEIGGYFGGRDHTTVMHSIRITDERMAADAYYARQIHQIEERLGPGR
jgi:chromosomal replication initiator protein